MGKAVGPMVDEAHLQEKTSGRKQLLITVE